MLRAWEAAAARVYTSHEAFRLRGSWPKSRSRALAGDSVEYEMVEGGVTPRAGQSAEKVAAGPRDSSEADVQGSIDSSGGWRTLEGDVVSWWGRGRWIRPSTAVLRQSGLSAGKAGLPASAELETPPNPR